MYDQLMNIVRDVSQQTIANNPEVPADREQEVMAEAGNSVVTTLQNLMANGQAQQVLGLFGSNAQNVQGNPVTNAITGSFVNNISKRLGISPQVAGAIAAVAIPLILKKLVSRTNDPQDNSLNVQDIFNTLSGNRTSELNLPNILSRFTGGGGQSTNQYQQGNGMDRDGDGDVDLNDLVGAFSGQQHQQQQQQGGGLFDMLKGVLGGR